MKGDGKTFYLAFNFLPTGVYIPREIHRTDNEYSTNCLDMGRLSWDGMWVVKEKAKTNICI